MSNFTDTASSYGSAAGTQLTSGAYGAATTTGGYPHYLWCTQCGLQYPGSGPHICTSGYGQPTFSQCTACGGFYVSGSGHTCTFSWGTTGIGQTQYQSFPATPILKECKEITTDASLEFTVSNTSFLKRDLIIPSFLSSCFMKVGSTWISLFPLIFSAKADGEEALKFYLVKEIENKKTAQTDDKVSLEGCILVEITDNLDVIQLSERAKSFLNK